ncbi:glycine zipper 2TM domain-containing protein [Rhodanobacter sp. BL-MT-08]
MKTTTMKSRFARLPLALAMAAGAVLAGCATPQYSGYQQRQGYATRCQNCGVVQQVDQVYVQGGGGNGNGGTLGAVIGAVAGGVLGSTIGKGDGRTAATVVGAVGGGVVGNQIGRNSDGGGGGTAWRIVVRMDNGQYATVTQRENPRVPNGAYVSIHDGHVYPQ